MTDPQYYQRENNQEVNYEYQESNISSESLNYNQVEGEVNNVETTLTTTQDFDPEWNDYIKGINTPAHYDNSKGSLYKFAEDHKLNSWEFDILKRVVRCRKKGQFLEDINKTIEVLKLYKKEYNEKT